MAFTGTVEGSFFASVGNDRPFYYYHFNNYLKHLSSNGVLTRGAALGSELLVTPLSATMQSNVAVGAYTCEGTLADVTVAGAVTHDTADVTNPRIDIVVVEANHDVGTRAASIKIVKGTPAASPSAPALTQSSTIWQEKLCEVLIPAGETDAANFTYTDHRVAATSLFDLGDGSIDDDKLAADNKVGSLAGLTTTAKTDAVVAINEVKGLADAAQSTATSKTGTSHDHDGGDGAQIPTGGIQDGAVTSDKLATGAVTHEKIADPYYCCAWSGTQAYTGANTYTRISSDGVHVTDPYDMRPHGESKIYAPIDGLYMVAANSSIAATDITNGHIIVRKNGAGLNELDASVQCAAGEERLLSIFGVVQLTAGDYIDVVNYVSPGGATGTLGSCFVHVARIS